jgi:osmotically-inducible protein OsmY
MLASPIPRRIIVKSKILLACLMFSVLGSQAAGSARLAAADAISPEPLAFADDSRITGAIKAKLADENLGGSIQVGVDRTQQGAVQLSGTAANQSEADRAVAIARGTAGVTSVNSDITIQE